MSADARHLAQLNETAITVREFAGSSANLAMAAHLVSLEQSYLDQLVYAKPEQVAGCQWSIQQCRALRALLRGEPHQNGRI